MGERKTWGDATVKNSQAKAYLDGYKIDGTGTASILIGSKQATLTDNGTGDYTITFNQPYAREIIPVVSLITSGMIAEIFSVSASAVRVKISNPQLKANAYNVAYAESFANFTAGLAAAAADLSAYNTAYTAGVAAARVTAAAAGVAAAAAVTGFADADFELHVLGFAYPQEY